jgi:hypothetical protein
VKLTPNLIGRHFTPKELSIEFNRVDGLVRLLIEQLDAKPSDASLD